MTNGPPDGSVVQWEDIAGEFDWKTLLLGNGLSVNIWPRFAYGSLFDYARDEGLTDEDRELFAETVNFERVLGDLSTAIRVSDVLGVDTARFYERYRSVQLALGNAIRAVFLPFVDNFRHGEFDGRHARVYVGQIPVYFLHGALHLIVSGSGLTRKLKQTTIRTLLEQFGQPTPGDPAARPLLVTEGSSRDKLRVIEANAYLAHCLDRLRERAEPTVVFGSSLSVQDQHLVDALNEHPDRPVAVSMLPGTKRALGPQQMEIYGRLEVETLLFFDATSHPLGAPDLRAALR